MHMSCRFKKLSKLLAFLFLTAYYTTPAYAACTPTSGGVNIGNCFDFGDFGSFGELTNNLVTPIFSVAAALIVIYFLWGAFKYLQSGGNKEEVAGARGMITHAIIGFIILIFAFLILQFLLWSLFGINNLNLFGVPPKGPKIKA